MLIIRLFLVFSVMVGIGTYVMPAAAQERVRFTFDDAMTPWLLLAATEATGAPRNGAVSLLSSMKKGEIYWPWRGAVIDSVGGDNGPELVERLVSAGANSVEIILAVRHHARFERLPLDVAWRRTLAWADSLLDACRRLGIVGIVTFSQVPTDPALELNQNSPEFWDSETLRKTAVESAVRIARHFKSRGAELAAYEFINEPLVRRGKRQETPAAWPALQNEIIEAVRREDSDRYLVVSAGYGGESSAYKGFKPLPYPKIIYGAHVYNPHAYTHQGIGGRDRGLLYPGQVGGRSWNKEQLRRNLASLVEFQRTNNALVWIGEFSAVRWAGGADQYVADLMEMFDELGFGWAYFAASGYHGWNPFFDREFATDKREEWTRHRVGASSSRWKTVVEGLRKPVPVRVIKD